MGAGVSLLFSVAGGMTYPKSAKGLKILEQAYYEQASECLLQPPFMISFPHFGRYDLQVESMRKCVVHLLNASRLLLTQPDLLSKDIPPENRVKLTFDLSILNLVTPLPARLFSANRSTIPHDSLAFLSATTFDIDPNSRSQEDRSKTGSEHPKNDSKSTSNDDHAIRFSEEEHVNIHLVENEMDGLLVNLTARFAFVDYLLDIETVLVYLSQNIVRTWGTDTQLLATPEAFEASVETDAARELLRLVEQQVSLAVSTTVLTEITEWETQQLPLAASADHAASMAGLQVSSEFGSAIQRHAWAAFRHASLASATPLQQRLAFIIPIRNRELHVSRFTKSMESKFRRLPLKLASPKMFFIEQLDSKPFNRGKLLNVGFMEALQQGRYEYMAFHDVDMIPMKDEVDYSFPASGPRHLATCVEQFEWTLPYDHYFGGVTILSVEQMLRSNGYSNRYWGWGGEDDDFYRRILKAGFKIHRKEPYCTHGIFQSLDEEHVQAPGDDFRYEKLRFFDTYWYIDGLSNLKYRKVSEVDSGSHTRIGVRI